MRLYSGEDTLYVVRRVVRFASKVAAYQACNFIGMPECSVHLAQAVVHISLAPKSNSLYVAYGIAKKDKYMQMKILRSQYLWLFVTLRPGLMKELDYGKGYQYAHDTAEKLTNMQYLMNSLVGKEQIKSWKNQCKTPPGTQEGNN